MRPLPLRTSSRVPTVCIAACAAAALLAGCSGRESSDAAATSHTPIASTAVQSEAAPQGGAARPAADQDPRIVRYRSLLSDAGLAVPPPATLTAIATGVCERLAAGEPPATVAAHLHEWGAWAVPGTGDPAGVAITLVDGANETYCTD
ncbi:DUF732 domain-containing protein [Rhodococcus rhodnii]|uniref:DUF732 domain-containing protein n=2 Tax=Rhodococcus rhodnii TaxID=38312 RepID=R7WTB3_9NOCA|nr:DUF732 domain-containing protein [Rhodococcus rhodnii]EOM78512.1 hypothetical protein Rrhod_0049 [Rhodococcus rhodnii LMG 5362]TXG91306.1 DUF732 domain-containing protein [Rhodococcus rhodnii]